MLACVDLAGIGQVVAFEPNGHVLPYLQQTIAGLPWAVELIEAAVAAAPEQQAPLAVDLSWSGSTTLGNQLPTRTPAAVRVDHFMRWPSC